jgi:hypothetical protein
MQKHGRFALMSSRHPSVEKYPLYSCTLFEGTIFPSSNRHTVITGLTAASTPFSTTPPYIYIYIYIYKTPTNFR